MNLIFSLKSKAIIYAIALLLLPVIVFSQTNRYTGASGGNWNTNGNWSLGIVPTAAHDVLINTNVTINVNTSPTINSLTINTNATVTLAASGGATAITIDNNGSTVALGSTLTIIGVTGGGTRSFTIQYLAGGTRTMSIGGTLNVNLVSNDPGIYSATNSATTVTGTINNNGGTITSTAANLSFSAGGTYNHQTNGSAVPTATWNSTSNCNITGITGTLPTGLGQSFGNLTWDCIGETTGFLFAEVLTTVNGNLTIGNTNTFGLFMATSTNSNYTLTIGGNLTINDNAWFGIVNGDNIVATVNVGGNFTMSGAGTLTTFFDYYIPTTASSTMRKIIMNVTGNVSQSGGLFDFCFGNTDVANFTELTIGGNYSLTGTGVMETTTLDTDVTNGTITFNKSGTQTVYVETTADLAYANFIVASTSTTQLLSNVQVSTSTAANFAGNFTVNGILNAGTNQITEDPIATPNFNNKFILNSGAGLITANVNGVQNGTIGTISTSIITRTYSSAANYTYNNASAIQNSGTFTTTPTANQVNNLTINNGAANTTTGVTLEQPIAVAGTLTLTSGHITTTSNLLTMNAGSNVAGSNYVARTSGGSDDSFVNGPMKKLGNTAFLFPVGKVNAGHHFCGLSASGAATDSYTAEYKRASATALGAIGVVGLDHVSNCEYWDIARLVGATNKDVVLSWNGNSNCNAAVYVNNLATLVAAHFNGTNWNTFGGVFDAGSLVSAGSLTWTNQSSFSPYSLGSTDKTKNPLPVKLINVKAYRNGDKNKIEWTNVTESDVAAYEVQKSVNGTNFDMITSLSARSNASDKQDYAAYDYQVGPVAYYRIKVLSADGSTTYSAIVKVAADVKVNTELVLYPNPVTGKQFTIQLNSAPTDYSLRVYAANGQLVTTENFKHPGGNFSKTVELPAQLPAGQYYLQLSGGEQVLSTKFVLQ